MGRLATKWPVTCDMAQSETRAQTSGRSVKNVVRNEKEIRQGQREVEQQELEGQSRDRDIEGNLDWSPMCPQQVKVMRNHW